MKKTTKIIYLPYRSQSQKDKQCIDKPEPQHLEETMDKIGYFFGGAVFACIMFILAHYLG